MPTLPDFTHEDVLDAIAQYERAGLPAGFRPSHSYDVLHDGRRYPPPAIAALAAARITGIMSPPGDVKGGEGTPCFRLLRRAGFRVVPKLGVIPFERGQEISRADLKLYLGTGETTKGDWATGSHFHRDPSAGIEGWWFLFPNVGNAGRTGHDYPNQWVSETDLRWLAKTPSRLGQPQIDSLLSGAYPVLLFTREHERSPFTFQGEVEAVHCEAGPPVQVIWRTESRTTAPLAPEEGAAEPPSGMDAREVVRREIRARRGQQRFRDELLRVYGRRCAISGCDIVDLLEAAHIRPYRGLVDDNDPSNGLLLRCDIHTLFDLDLLGIEPEILVVHLHESVCRPPYAALEGTVLPRGSLIPNSASLRGRWRRFVAGRDS